MINSGIALFHDSLEGLLVPIDVVQQHPDNYNNGDLDKIIESIEINGMYRPLYVQKSTGYIMAGNHTWEACKHLGAQTVPALYLDVDDATAKRIMLADNRIAALAAPDPALLVNLLNQVQETDSLLGTGWVDRDLDALRLLAEADLSYDEHATWPTLHFQVPPHVRSAFYQLTEVAVGDRERFELLLRLAGWDGKKK